MKLLLICIAVLIAGCGESVGGYAYDPKPILRTEPKPEPETIYDADGVRTLNFETYNDAQTWYSRDYSGSVDYRVFIMAQEYMPQPQCQLVKHGTSYAYDF